MQNKKKKKKKKKKTYQVLCTNKALPAPVLARLRSDSWTLVQVQDYVVWTLSEFEKPSLRPFVYPLGPTGIAGPDASPVSVHLLP